MLTLEKFEQASEIVKKVTNPTKLVYSEYLSSQSGGKVYLKPENMQYTGAYKVRGAYYKISTMSEEEREKGLITASSGNHAQGVAYAAQKFGCKATIVMPTITPLIKVTVLRVTGQMSCFMAMSMMMPARMQSSWQRRTAIHSCIRLTTWISRPAREPSLWRSCRSFLRWITYWCQSAAADL